MSKFGYEFSAGGVVINGDKVLIIKTKNLKGEIVHTFPKGNISKGEKPEDTALREVLEETGYRCKILKEIKKVQYFYKREGKLIKKTVHWFLMEPVEKVKEHDFEVLETLWVEKNRLDGILSYKSDLEIVKLCS